MLDQHILRETLKDPLVTETLLGGKPLRRVPFETTSDEIYKRIIRCVSELDHNVFQSLFLLLRG